MPEAGPRAGPEADDRELVGRALSGEAGAFAALVLRYEARALGWARGVVHHADDARDVVQEVFLRVFRALPEYRGESAFSTWLYRITFNLSLTWRDRVRSRHVPLEPEAQDALADPGPLLEDRVAGAREAEAVRAAVLRLPAHSRSWSSSTISGG